MTRIVDAFRAAFAATPRVHWAPGRVNLIGDHVDYCGGRVLPMPIQYGTTVAIAARADRRVRARSLERREALEFDLGCAPSLARGHWGRFVVGASAVARDFGAEAGCDVLVSGDIPGSGLSSSASLSVALLHAIAACFDLPLAGIALARAAQRIEHEHVGVACGLMDQAVIALGEPGAAYLFDCASGIGRAIPLGTNAPAIAVLDSRKPRALVDSAYNVRLAQTRAAASAIGCPHERLAGADPADLVRVADPTARRRARHVVEEQRRVDAAAEALQRQDWAGLGRLLDASHSSLRDLYEVSGDELDALVDACKREPTCFGARLTGAGFGGSVVALFARDGLDAALRRVMARYHSRVGLNASAFCAESVGAVRAR